MNHIAQKMLDDLRGQDRRNRAVNQYRRRFDMTAFGVYALCASFWFCVILYFLYLIQK